MTSLCRNERCSAHASASPGDHLPRRADPGRTPCRRSVGSGGVPCAVPRRDHAGHPARPARLAGPGRDRRHRHLRPHARGAGRSAPGWPGATRPAASAGCTGRACTCATGGTSRRRPTSPLSASSTCARPPAAAGSVRRSRCSPPTGPARPGPRIHNDQLIRYAGHRTPSGAVRGDGQYVEFTDRAVALGWRRPDPPGRFDVLPLLVSARRRRAGDLRAARPTRCWRSRCRHPDHDWFAELRLRWHAVPAISNMPLRDRRRHLPGRPVQRLVPRHRDRRPQPRRRRPLRPAAGHRRAARAGHQLRAHALARPRARRDGAGRAALLRRRGRDDGRPPHRVASASSRHVDREERAGRRCPADWSWIVPPVSGGLTPVYHRYYDEPDPTTRPAFLLPAPRPAT